MKPIVLYSTKSSNTQKIAQEIASELACEALRIGQASQIPIVDLNDFDLIFVGTGIYWGNPNSDLERFLEKTDLKNHKQFAFFLTWGGAGKTNHSALTKLSSILEAKGHQVMGEKFQCYGGRRFTVLKRGHPDDKDTQDAKLWARKVANDASETDVK
jgi:flavodoxin